MRWSVILWISWIFLILVSQWDSSRLCWLIHCAWTISGSIVQKWEDMKESRYLACIQFLTVGNVGLGQIYEFHLSLWAEHLGILEDLFKDWELLESVLSEWDGPSKLGAIFAEEVTNMKGISWGMPYLLRWFGMAVLSHFLATKHFLMWVATT